MISYKLRVNPSLRGKITLPSIDHPLVAGNAVTLTEDQYNRSEIQMAIKKEYLSVEGEQNDPREPAHPDMDESNYVDTSLDDPDDIDLDINPLDYEVKGKTTVWDPETNSGLDVKAGKKKALGQINSVEMEMSTGKVDFTKKSEKVDVDKKPRGTRSPKDKAVKIAQKEAKVLPMPNSSSVDLMTNRASDVTFVDQEQEIERISKHPVLKKKLQQMADELLEEAGEEAETEAATVKKPTRKKAPRKKAPQKKVAKKTTKKATKKKVTAKQNEEVE